jgi:hypothetical protein
MSGAERVALCWTSGHYLPIGASKLARSRPLPDVTFFEVVSCVQIHGHSCVHGLAGHGSVWMVSTLTLKLGNPLEGLLPGVIATRLSHKPTISSMLQK